MWLSIDSSFLIAIAIHNYEASDSKHLNLSIGDIVNVTKHNGNWYFGHLRTDLQRRGIFPKAYVHVIEESLVRNNSPILKEISDTIREWKPRLLDAFVDDEHCFIKIKSCVADLIAERKRLISGKLTSEETRDTQSRVALLLDKGNARLGMDLVLRDDEMRSLDPMLYSCMELYERHESKDKEVNNATSQSVGQGAAVINNNVITIDKTPQMCLLITVCSVNNLTCADPLEIIFTLYNSSNATHVTEPVFFWWPPNGNLDTSSASAQTNGGSACLCRFLFADLELSGNMAAGLSAVGAVTNCQLAVQLVRNGPMQHDTHRKPTLLSSDRSSSLSSSNGLSSSGRLRRPFGAGLADLAAVFKSTAGFNNLDELDFTVPLVIDHESRLDEIVKRSSNTSAVSGGTGGASVVVRIRKLLGSINEVCNEYSEVAELDAIGRRLGFTSGLPIPEEVRNQLFITIVSGNFPVEKNVEVELNVFDNTGRRTGVISMERLRSQQRIRSGVEDLTNESQQLLPPQSRHPTNYKSVVYYHQNSPKWLETVKLELPQEEEESYLDLHVQFTFRRRSSKPNRQSQPPFAMSFLKLMQSDNTMIKNAEHSLAVYKVDGKRSLDPYSYLKLPSLTSDVPTSEFCTGTAERPQITAGNLELSSRTTFLVRSLLCSTRFTQNEHIMGILKWRSYYPENRDKLLRHLAGLCKNDNLHTEEIMMFLTQLLEELFYLLSKFVANKESPNMEDAVFEAVVMVIGLTLRGFRHWQSAVLSYVESKFVGPAVYAPLLRSLARKLQPTMLQRSHQQVKHMTGGANCNFEVILFRAFKPLFKIVVTSKLQQLGLSATENASEANEFNTLMSIVWEALNHLMTAQDSDFGNQDPAKMVRVCVLENLPDIVEDLVRVLPATEVTSKVASIIRPVNQLMKYKSLLNLANISIFRSRPCRAILMPDFEAYLTTTVNEMVEIHEKLVYSANETHGNRDTIAQQFCDLKSRVLSVLLINLASLPPAEIEEDVRVLVDGSCIDGHGFPILGGGLLRALVRLSALLMEFNPEGDQLVRQVVAATLTLLQLMTLNHWQRWTQNLDRFSVQRRTASLLLIQQGRLDLTDAFMELLCFFKSLCKSQYTVFPSGRSSTSHAVWFDMYCRQNDLLLTTLQNTLQVILRPKFLDPFDKHVVFTYFETGVYFLTQAHLQREAWPQWKNERVCTRLSLAVDLRPTAALLLRDLWNSLDTARQHLIPDLAGVLLEMALVPLPGLRADSVRLLVDMMRYELQVMNAEHKRFPLCEEEVIEQLDRLLESKGDAKFAEQLCQCLKKECASEPVLAATMQGFVETLNDQMIFLLEYKEFIHDESPDNRILAINNLLRFYKTIKREHMYVRYLHKLYKLNQQCENWTEAGCTLLLMAQQHLSWEVTPLPETHRFPSYPQLTTHRELKEQLMNDAIDLLKRGNLWQKAKDVCENLIEFYNHITLDYVRLQIVYKKVADLCGEISPGKLVALHPNYYRITFTGRGFPAFLLRDMGFVYRSGDLVTIGDVMDTFRQSFPNAIVGPKEAADGSQSIRITVIKPVCEPPPSMQHGDHDIMQYYRHNEVQKFQLKRFIRGQDNITNLVTELRTLRAADRFPSVVRLLPIEDEQIREIGPVENAILGVVEKSEQIQFLLWQIRRKLNENTSQLVQAVQGVIDAQVQGGLDNYKDFFEDEFRVRVTPAEVPLLNRLGEVLVLQMHIIDEAVQELLSRVRPTDAAWGLVERLHQCLVLKVAMVEQEWGLTVALPVSHLSPLDRTNAPRATGKKDIIFVRAGGRVATGMEVARNVAFPSTRRPSDANLPVAQPLSNRISSRPLSGVSCGSTCSNSDALPSVNETAQLPPDRPERRQPSNEQPPPRPERSVRRDSQAQRTNAPNSSTT